MVTIKTKGKRLPKIRTTGKRLPRVDPNQVATALSAEPMDTSVSGASPPTLFAIRQELAQRLISTGGRPSLKGASRRQKIPMQHDDWLKLQQLSLVISDGQLKPTPSQLASVIIHQALKQMTPEQIRLALTAD